ncbi:MAG: hypothetical protein KBC64_06745 [Simkaniaceae bacterium]|nr:hypothetical protein [Simkaniaceae bacterium]
MAISSYDPAANIAKRFMSLVWEGIKPEASVDHTRGAVEKVGDRVLYLPENLPRYIKILCTHPQAITTAAFAALHFANSYLFYPEMTAEMTGMAMSYLPEITADMARFSAWLATSGLITGYCGRAGGRLTEAYIAGLHAQGGGNAG